MFEMYVFNEDEDSYCKLEDDKFYSCGSYENPDTHETCEFHQLKAEQDYKLFKPGSIVKVCTLQDLMDLYSVLLKMHNFDYVITDLVMRAVEKEQDVKNINDLFVEKFKNMWLYGFVDMNKYYKILEFYKEPIYLYYCPYGFSKDYFIPIAGGDFDFLRKFTIQ